MDAASFKYMAIEIQSPVAYPQNPFPDKKLEKLVVSIAIYIPNTEKDDKVIKDEDYKSRISQAQDFLLDLFGGYTLLGEGKGEFISKKGKRLKDKIARIVSYSDVSKFDNEKEKLYNWMVKKKEEWSQESIAFEFCGDLYYL